jgi:tetratricopeptide (TPR) repeat protein
MDPERWKAIGNLFEAALGRRPEDRADFLAACGLDDVLRAEVVRMLARDGESGSLLDQTAVAAAALDFVGAAPQMPFQLGSYEVTERLGVGGMGCVYRARDLRLHRQVALKLLPEHLAADPAARSSLQREAVAAAALDHPFICKIYDIVEHGGVLIIAMELIEGQTLATRLRHPIAFADAVRIAGEIAEALEAAHVRGVSHQDLTPANVMLTTGGRVKVLDFGLAKRLGSSPIDAPGGGPRSRYGTPAYMAPEQVRDEPSDLRVDIFAFGLILCELVAGCHPFRRQTASATMAAIEGEPPDLSGATREISPQTAALLARLLAKSPQARPSTMGEVRRALQQTMSPGRTVLTGSTAGTLARAPLVERDQEIRLLEEHLSAALAGTGAVVLISGEPGIGKTSLAQALLAMAEARGARTSIGRCRETGGSAPYGPFVEIFEGLLSTLPDADAREILGDSLPEMARLMPTATRRFGGARAPAERPLHPQRRVLFNAFRDVLRRLGCFGPRAFVLEDLHWADEPTLLLLQHAAEMAGELPLMLIGTHRDGDIDLSSAFVRTLDGLIRGRHARRLTLRRLTLPAVGSLLEAMSGRQPPTCLTKAIHQSTAGNPFFVEEVYEHLREEGRLFAPDGGWQLNPQAWDLSVPDSVRVVLRHRLGRLRPGTVKVMTTAALIGESFSTLLLERLCEGGAEPVTDAIEQAEAAGLIELERAEREPRYQFQHTLVRRALIDSLSLPRRQQLHARIAAVIEQVYAGRLDRAAPSLAHHLLEASEAADVEKTVQYLALASEGSRAAAAYEESLKYVDAALALLDEETGTRVAGLHEARADVLRSLGRFEPAVAAYECAIALYGRSGDAARLAEATFPLTLIHAWNADARRHLNATTRALERVRDAPPALRARLLFLHALALSASGDAEGGLAAVEEAKALASRVADPALDVIAAVQEAHVCYHAMQIHRALDASRRATRLCVAAHDLWGSIDMEWHQVMGAVYDARPCHAKQMIAAARPQAERVGHHNVIWFYHLLTSALAMGEGAFERARANGHDALALGQEYGIPWNFSTEMTLGQVAFYRGDADEALVHYQRAVAMEPESYWSGISRAALFASLAQLQRREAATVLHHGPLPLPVPHQANVFGRWVNLTYLVEGLAWAGRFDEAAALLPSTEALVATGVKCFRDMRLYRTTAGIAAACAGNWRRADEHFEAALREAGEAPLPIAHAHARLWRGKLLQALGSGRSHEAPASLGEAKARFERLRMPSFAAEAARLLAAQGAHHSPRRA